MTLEPRQLTKLTNIYGKFDVKNNPEDLMQVLALLSGTKYSKQDIEYLLSD